ncbi:serine hydrolase domain-containing protein [Alteromonas gracilis]|uniref:serine hydrolase domain-containing protein n=1 Tax=Alteromonas gracilis TaxID=1479524 RepID=UPI0030D0726A
MKTAVRLLFVCTVIYSVSGISSEPQHDSTLDKMEALRDEFTLPSLSVAISLNNEIAFAQAIGFSDVNTSRPATIKTQYSVGSLAKPMTGLALVKLADLKKIDLTSPVSDYVDALEYADSFSVLELAAHISGIPHNTPERAIAEFEEVKDHERPKDAFYVFDSHPLLTSPGSEYLYSSNGYILLSAVIENAAQQRYVDFLNKSLWQTFDMNSTEHDTSFAGKDNEATYYQDYQDSQHYTESVKKRDRSFLFGGGGFISTPTDLVNMARATFDEEYLSKEAQRLLSTPVKLRSGKVNDDNYSLGWRVGKLQLDESDENLFTVLHHGGVTDKASTAYLLVIPQCKAAIAFATNYVPDQFWKMRGRMAKILIGYLNESKCLE